MLQLTYSLMRLFPDSFFTPLSSFWTLLLFFPHRQGTEVVVHTTDPSLTEGGSLQSRNKSRGVKIIVGDCDQNPFWIDGSRGNQCWTDMNNNNHHHPLVALLLCCSNIARLALFCVVIIYGLSLTLIITIATCKSSVWMWWPMSLEQMSLTITLHPVTTTHFLFAPSISKPRAPSIFDVIPPIHITRVDACAMSLS
jgi:hypothetical protein